MPRIPSGRKHLEPLHGGPWLVQRVFWFFGPMTLIGVSLTLGTGFVCSVWKQATNVFTVFLAAAGALMAIGGPVIGGLWWLLSRTVQTCPDCLRGMDRGAYVCPWCGFRETPRQEQP